MHKAPPESWFISQDALWPPSQNTLSTGAHPSTALARARLDSPLFREYRCELLVAACAIRTDARIQDTRMQQFVVMGTVLHTERC